MSWNRLIESVLFGLLAIVVLWHGYDFFVTVRPAEYYAERPIRLLYVGGLAVLLALYVAFLLSRSSRRKGKGGDN